MGCLPLAQERDWRCEVSSSLHGEIVSSYAAAEGRDVSRAEGHAMTFDEILEQAIEILRRRGRLTYRALKRQFDLDDAYLDDLKEELIYGQRLARDEDDRVLVWLVETASVSPPTSVPISAPAADPQPSPLAYTPPYLTEKILTSRSALEGERKQVTVLFADLKGSMELLADRDPEEARQ